MANCHDLFQEFYEQIILSQTKRDYLIRARDAIRDKIKKYFLEKLGQAAPEFAEQGSFMMGTIVNPLNGEFDIDDGVYLQNLDPDKSKWPVPETVHNWILKAVEGHTQQPPKNKRTCVRVIYAGEYHVDLPIYGIYNGASYLAEKGEMDWPASNPQAFTKWFELNVENKGQQLRKVVQYMKAWTDYKSNLGQLPSGFILTILVVKSYEYSKRDDGAFAGTTRNIYNDLLSGTTILNPVDPNENLDERVSPSQMNNFKERILTLLDNASGALKEENKINACKRWKREFGDRFPKCEDLKKGDIPLKTSAPAILKDDARSA